MKNLTWVGYLWLILNVAGVAGYILMAGERVKITAGKAIFQFLYVFIMYALLLTVGFNQ